MKLDVLDVARDCLLAGALGDVWGAPFEGQVGPVDPVWPAFPRVSDDTGLTLATCEAIVRDEGRVSPETVAAQFRGWFTSGRLAGVGSATWKALRDLARGATQATVVALSCRVIEMDTRMCRSRGTRPAYTDSHPSPPTFPSKPFIRSANGSLDQPHTFCCHRRVGLAVERAACARGTNQIGGVEMNGSRSNGVRGRAGAGGIAAALAAAACVACGGGGAS